MIPTRDCFMCNKPMVLQKDTYDEERDKGVRHWRCDPCGYTHEIPYHKNAVEPCS
jgi:hypothetical protein